VARDAPLWFAPELGRMVGSGDSQTSQVMSASISRDISVQLGWSTNGSVLSKIQLLLKFCLVESHC
jgi:hypothetical protein